MKKSTKRILCGALSLAMCSTLVAESALRLNAEQGKSSNAFGSLTASAPFTEVSGLFDPTQLKESYFNKNVLKSEEVAPVYETRTVIVSLAGDTIVERADGAAVSQYLGTWSGEMAQSDIAIEQASFLQALSEKGIAYELEHAYSSVTNAVAIEIDTKYVSEIKQMRGVEGVYISNSYAFPKTYTDARNNVVTNTTSVYETGIYDSSLFTTDPNPDSEVQTVNYGSGSVVAVLDTGLDYTHPAFQGFKTKNVKKAWNKGYVTDKVQNGQLSAVARSGALEVADVYVSEKVPFAYDYADDDPDVYPSYSNHGTHVAGIIGGYDPSGYTDKDGNHIDDTFLGVVPDTQLVICKVFTDDLDDPDLGGATTEDIVAALDDCVKLGVDVINMSLGSSCGFSTTDDGDYEGWLLNDVYTRVGEAGISLICAASNDYSAGYGGVYGTNLATNPDSSTVGSPSTFASALSVASINGQKASYLLGNPDNEDTLSYAFYEEARDINSNELNFIEGMLGTSRTSGAFEYVVIPGVGHASDYSYGIKEALKTGNKIALVKRGDTTFQEKIEMAMKMGAKGVIIYNNVAGMIRMNVGEIKNPIPAISISMNAGAALVKGANAEGIGKVYLDTKQVAGPFMSDFSSWGPTHDLKLKPEITAHGGEITSAVPGGYGEQSGTSMATPNMAGFMAVVRNYIRENFADEVSTNGAIDSVKLNRLAMQLTMSTAGTVYDQDHLPYSPRKQGAGVAKLENVIAKTSAYLSTDNAEIDDRPKVELGDDKTKKGVYDVSFNVTNFGSTALTFTAKSSFMTETLSSDKLTVSEQAYLLKNSKAEWKVGGEKLSGDTITVAPGEVKAITVTFTLGDADRQYIETSFKNGMYVEGFVTLASTDTEKQCDLNLPFLGFYGDWDQAPMLDYSAYEIAKDQQDASVKDEDKIQASVWATQPYTNYYNNKYVLPMGSYVYLLPEDAEEMYISEEHNSVSRYNEYYGEGNVDNYLTSTSIKSVYTGLLRNARIVKYRLIDEETGEIVYTNTINRVAKAYAGGGQARPANVELELDPEAIGLMANGRYRIELDFYKDALKTPDEQPKEGNTFSFSFTVDYEAPVLEDVRVRYYNYEENNKQKQRIYLDVDVYDNHYAQSIMLCYPTLGADGELTLQLVTDYPTPVRNAVRNGTTTVSIEITDIYEKYGENLYLMIDDYSVNTCQYRIDLAAANRAAIDMEKSGIALTTPDEITLNLYQTHKAQLAFGSNYTGRADTSNFNWFSRNPSCVAVKNGEIVALKQPNNKDHSVVITVDNRKSGAEAWKKEIKVYVTDTVDSSFITVPSISMGVITTATDALQKADGLVEVNAGKTIEMSYLTDPWYHPMEGLRVVWSVEQDANSVVAAKIVDPLKGVVETVAEGIATVRATVQQQDAKGAWKDTQSIATCVLDVQEEFVVENFTLTKYNGVGYNEENEVLRIPTDKNIMYIGAEAFKDNANVKKVIIPASVMEIQKQAFEGCTALEEVYFDELTPQAIRDADVSMIYEQAFMSCPNLRYVDFSNVKTVTLAEKTFYECPKLTTVDGMTNVGTMHHYAFAGSALETIDISGLHMSGDYVFAGCNSLNKITTGKFTAIGKYMFKDCLGLQDKEKVVIQTTKIGEGAFYGCINLAGVRLQTPDTEPEDVKLEFDIGARAFAYCGTQVGSFSIDFAGEKIRSIGAGAFEYSALSELGVISGLEVLGANAFAETKLSTFTINDELDFFSVDDDSEIAPIRLTGIPFQNLTVAVDPASEKYEEIDGVIYTKGTSDKTLLFVNGSLTGDFSVPDGVVTIGDYAFSASKLTSVRLATTAAASSVVNLGVGAFAGSAIQSIDFANANITDIPESAFAESKIKSIALPDTVKSIGYQAFYKTPLESFTASSLESIASNAFESCEALQAIVLPETVKEMGSEVFSYCTNLESATLPSLGEDCLGSYTFFGAIKLKTVVFGKEAATTGEFTFGGGYDFEKESYSVGAPVENVTLGSKVTKIGKGLFYQSTAIKEITLPDGVTEVEDYAFSGATALTTVNGLSQVVTFGAEAFYDAAITGTLDLAEAQTIGDMAFARHRSKPSTYTAISIPNAVAIGSYAFFNGGESTVEIPASAVSIGDAAFGASTKLTGFTVAGGDRFFAEEGVLYRYINKANGEYELTSYPTALVQEEVEGKRTYAVKEGTLRVLASAFFAINQGTVNAVVLPYSINVIGDNAFFESGITDYTFESIQAPTLETVFRAEINQAIENGSLEPKHYKGYYHTNFETYLYRFSKYGGETSTLTMRYPSNGKGYDNYVYSLYFGNRIPSASALIEDNTRTLISLVNGFDVEKVESWLTATKTDELVAEVSAFAADLKTARIYYNNAIKNAGQAPFISTELEEKLFDVETKLRAVKKRLDMPFKISELILAEDTAHQTEYFVGDVFKLEGLKLTIIYDDYSTEEADSSKIRLLTTSPMRKSTERVQISYDGVKMYVAVKVTDPNEQKPTPAPDDSVEPVEEDGGCGSFVGGFAYGAIALAVAAAFVATKKKNSDKE